MRGEGGGWGKQSVSLTANVQDPGKLSAPGSLAVERRPRESTTKSEVVQKCALLSYLNSVGTLKGEMLGRRLSNTFNMEAAILTYPQSRHVRKRDCACSRNQSRVGPRTTPQCGRRTRVCVRTEARVLGEGNFNCVTIESGLKIAFLLNQSL